MGAKLILRIEDTDLKRSSKVFEDSIIADLKWLGLDWDEFYRQSDRLDIYIKSADRMLEGRESLQVFLYSSKAWRSLKMSNTFREGLQI